MGSAVVFQGTADTETPLSDSLAAGLPVDLRLITIPNGGHSNTYILVRKDIVQAALDILKRPR
jgi:hypothetical protein